MQNVPGFIKILTQLQQYKYGATTWPTAGKSFSTIFIKGWDGENRTFGQWNGYLQRVLRQMTGTNIGDYGERISSSTQRPANGRGNSGMGGYSLVGKLLLVPQISKNELPGDILLYRDLMNEKVRNRISNRLVEIIG